MLQSRLYVRACSREYRRLQRLHAGPQPTVYERALCAHAPFVRVVLRIFWFSEYVRFGKHLNNFKNDRFLTLHVSSLGMDLNL
jgi:hypothetical protein